MSFVRSNDLSLKYKRITPSGCKDIEIYKFKFLAKTQCSQCTIALQFQIQGVTINLLSMFHSTLFL